MHQQLVLHSIDLDLCSFPLKDVINPFHGAFAKTCHSIGVVNVGKAAQEGCQKADPVQNMDATVISWLASESFS